MIATALVLIVTAVVLLRMGWAGRRGMGVAGWVLFAAGAVALAALHGAWGLATATVTGICAAIALVLAAGWTAPVRAYRPAREPASVTLPRRSRDLARRLGVFMLVVPVAFAAAEALAFGAQALARRGGAGETDATVLTLFLQPLLWAGLMTWQMTRPTARRMIAAPASAAVLGAAMWSLS